MLAQQLARAAVIGDLHPTGPFGDVDYSRRRERVLSQHLQKLVANGVRKVLLNLIELTQVDSSGISIIVRTYVSLKRQGGDLGLVCPGGRVLEVFRVLHLLDTIPTFANEAQALASFRPRGYSATS